jgi:hypothetical protein
LAMTVCLTLASLSAALSSVPDILYQLQSRKDYEMGRMEESGDDATSAMYVMGEM